MTPVKFHWNSAGMVERFFSGLCIFNHWWRQFLNLNKLSSRFSNHSSLSNLSLSNDWWHFWWTFTSNLNTATIALDVYIRSPKGLYCLIHLEFKAESSVLVLSNTNVESLSQRPFSSKISSLAFLMQLHRLVEYLHSSGPAHLCQIWYCIPIDSNPVVLPIYLNLIDGFSYLHAEIPLNQLFLFFHHFTIYVTAKKGSNNNVIQQIYLHTEIPLNQHFPFIHDFNNYVTANMPKRVPTIMIYNRLSFVDKYIENSVNKLHKTKQVNR